MAQGHGLGSCQVYDLRNMKQYDFSALDCIERDVLNLLLGLEMSSTIRATSGRENFSRT